MNVNLYDILSKIIPGAVLFVTLAFCKIKLYEGSSEVVLGALLYTLGFFIDSASSTGDRLILSKSFGGRPGPLLLSGKQYRTIRLAYPDKISAIKAALNATNDEQLYGMMHAACVQGEKKRVVEFINSLNFSRNIFFTVLLCFCLVSFFESSKLLSLTFAVLSVLAWLRTKKRSFYYSKEVIDVFCLDYKPAA